MSNFDKEFSTAIIKEEYIDEVEQYFNTHLNKSE